MLTMCWQPLIFSDKERVPAQQMSTSVVSHAQFKLEIIFGVPNYTITPF